MHRGTRSLSLLWGKKKKKSLVRTQACCKGWIKCVALYTLAFEHPNVRREISMSIEETNLNENWLHSWNWFISDLTTIRKDKDRL